MAGAGDIRAGRAYVELGADTAPLQRGLEAMEGQLRGLAGTFGRGSVFTLAAKTLAGGGALMGLSYATRAFEEFSGKFRDTLKAFDSGKADALDIGAAIVSIIPGVESLSKAFANLWAGITGGQTGEQFRALQKEIQVSTALLVEFSKAATLASAPSGMRDSIQAEEDYRKNLAKIEQEAARLSEKGARWPEIKNFREQAFGEAERKHEADLANIETAHNARIRAAQDAAEHAQVAVGGDTYTTQIDDIERKGQAEIRAAMVAGEYDIARFRTKQLQEDEEKAWIDEHARLVKEANAANEKQNDEIAKRREDLYREGKRQAEELAKAEERRGEAQAAQALEIQKLQIQLRNPGGGRRAAQELLDAEYADKMRKARDAGESGSDIVKEYDLRRRLINQEWAARNARTELVGTFNPAALGQLAESDSNKRTASATEETVRILRRLLTAPGWRFS